MERLSSVLGSFSTKLGSNFVLVIGLAVRDKS